mmetsp:Transcript_39153/g.84543  ORF Transcript_39153/g.84543 Transcript_39153/m.84543 type:complete len:263 (+) Transcript_39153:769-1557(+)
MLQATRLKQPDQDAEGVQVGESIMRLLSQDFRSYKSRASCWEAKTPATSRFDPESPKSEIRELCSSKAIEDNILWLQITQQSVHTLVHVFEAQEDLGNPGLGQVGRLVASSSKFALISDSRYATEKIPAITEFHHQQIQTHIAAPMCMEQLDQGRVWNVPDSVGHLILPRSDGVIGVGMHHFHGISILAQLVLSSPNHTISTSSQFSLLGNSVKSPNSIWFRIFGGCRVRKLQKPRVVHTPFRVDRQEVLGVCHIETPSPPV